MSHKVDLPDGGWAEIRDPKELTQGGRKLIRQYTLGMLGARKQLQEIQSLKADATPEETEEAVATIMESFGAAGFASLEDMGAAFMCAYLLSWSLDRPLPATPAQVDELPAYLVDVLGPACMKLGDGTVDFSPDGAVDPTSPTEPSAA